MIDTANFNRMNEAKANLGSLVLATSLDLDAIKAQHAVYISAREQYHAECTADRHADAQRQSEQQKRRNKRYDQAMSMSKPDLCQELGIDYPTALSKTHLVWCYSGEMK